MTQTTPKSPKKIPTDRNFDTLVDKFEAKVYHTLKGQWRLQCLKQDLQDFMPSANKEPTSFQVWDAGCGLAQISQWLAQGGHQITLCDLSQKMLTRAQHSFDKQGLQASFLQGAAQELAPTLKPFDLVLFHAVLEWLAEPKQTLQTVASRVQPGGYLSLLFYNRNAVVFRGALKGDWRLDMLLNDAYMGKGKRLTPPNPQIPEEVTTWLQQWGFEITQHTGIRVFHDYMSNDAIAHSDEDKLLRLEQRYCRQATFRNMGRYIHLLAQKTL